jgi:hypothetical protein
MLRSWDGGTLSKNSAKEIGSGSSVGSTSSGACCSALSGACAMSGPLIDNVNDTGGYGCSRDVPPDVDQQDKEFLAQT